MKKILIYLSYFFISFTIISCFEIREEVTINYDGSGRYEMLVDFTQSKIMLENMLNIIEEEESNISAENPFLSIDSAFREGAIELNHVTGISNSKGIIDHENFLFGMQFDFENVDALNTALTQANGSENTVKFEPYYQYSKGKLTRSNTFNLDKLTEGIEPSQDSLGINQELNSQIETLYNQVTYK